VQAVWNTGPVGTTRTVTSVLVLPLESKQGSELFADQSTFTHDSSGNFTGATETFADVTSGFSVTLQQPLASASLSGSGLPGETCTFDANFNLIGCTAATIDVTVAWTGQGPITPWGESRTCGASVIRDILRGRLAADPDLHGVRLRGASLTGEPA
jgi:hypothetical protein